MAGAGGCSMNQDWIFDFFLLFPMASGVALFLFIRRRQKSQTPAGWGSLLLGNFLVFAFLLTLLFVTGEAYYRFFYDTTDSLAYTMVSQRWLDRYYILNSAGFRDNIEYSLKIAPAKRRISFLGDSFVAGHGIKNVENRFPNIIRRAHPEWEIHVLAKLGADTGDELALLQRILHDGYQLDQVVLIYDLNDVADIMPEWKASLKRIFADENRGGWLRHHSCFLDILYHRWKVAHDPDMRHYFDFVLKGYRGATWELQKRRLTELRDLVESHGGRLLVVTFPFLHDMGPNYRFQDVHKQLDRFWAGLNVPNLDLLPSFRNLPPSKLVVNKYDAHPNEYAHALAAKAIDQFLVAEVKTNAPAPAHLTPMK
jgi:hypothetical protein